MPRNNAAASNGNGRPGRKKQAAKCTALLAPNVQKKGRGGDNAKPSGTRMAFLKAYEENFGNVTIACKLAGIHRQTFYRWLESETRVNKKFRERLKLTKPEERQVDYLESAFNERVKDGSDTLIKFGLTAKGRGRGWVERQDTAVLDTEAITKLLDAFAEVVKQNPDMTESERALWIRDFAETGGVPVDTLARRIKVLELTEGGKK